MFRLLCLAGLFALPVASACDDQGSGSVEIQCEEDLEPGPVCLGFCETGVTECEAFTSPFDPCVEICECQLDLGQKRSEACGEAWEAEYTCAAALDCANFNGYVTRVPPESFPCRSESLTTDETCIDN